MMNFEIRMSVSKLKESSSTLKRGVSDKVIVKLIHKFGTHLRDVYVNLVLEQINSSRYNGKWEPVDDNGYVEYLGVVPKIDIVDLLRESLEIKELGRSLYLRVNPEMRYPGSDLTILKVLRALENGTTNFSARPILYKVAKRINSNLISLWLDWLGSKGLI